MAAKVQSVLVPRKGFTEAEARAWCKNHGFSTEKRDATERFFRFRQFEPGQCKGQPRSMKMGEDGVIAIVCEMGEGESMMGSREMMKER